MYKGLKLLFFITFSLCFVLKSFSQDKKKLAQDLIDQAVEVMTATKATDIARELYVQAAEADPANINANYMAGEFHINTIGKDRAVKYFLRVLDLNPEYRFDISYWIGRSYQYGMDFESALTYYKRYRSKLIQRDGYRGKDRTSLADVERRIYECENAKKYVANPAHYSIVNVGSAVNSEYEDYAPVLNQDETIMIFTSRRRDDNLNQNVDKDNKPFEDIFISTKENGVWSSAKNIGDIVNTPNHGSNLALSADGSLLFLYKDDNNGDIYVSERADDDTWSFPHPLSENINSEGFKESSMSISPDQSVLFFASDRPGGEGGIDIYYSIKDKNGEWTRSKNIGAKINTPVDDDGPFIDYDGKTLYFSTQGREGMGGYDIFKSVYDSAASDWSEPVNLGFPINTPDDDVFFVSTSDGKRGYYASVREDGQGYTDIYAVTILQEDEAGEAITSKKSEEKKAEEDSGKDKIQKVASKEIQLQPVAFTVTVLNENKRPVDAKISMVSTPDKIVAGKSNKGTGIYEFRVTNPNNKNYKLSVEKDGYVFQTLNVAVKAATTEPQQMNRTLILRKLQMGTRSVLRNIYFTFDKATFTKESYNELNKLETMMAQNTGMTIEISGHTDNIGAKTYNKKLSQHRANAVKDYLVRKGIDTRRIKAIGFGEEKPLASNDDEKEGREFNRRVEFKVTGGK